MGRRPYMSRFACGHSGCFEVGHYESATRADQADLYRRYSNGQWRCVRHSKPNEVLARDHAKIEHEVRCVEHWYESTLLGHTWEGAYTGFVFGPGFKAYANDFPPGTVLRVTAEIMPPAESSPSGGPAIPLTVQAEQINPDGGAE